MVREKLQSLFVHTITAVVVMGLIGRATAADEKPAGDKGKKARAEARGYLPPYYKNVIDGVQRDKIYKIQAQYEGKMDDLEKQLKTLADQRDAEIESLLTPEQKKRIQELSAEAKDKRAKKPEATARGSAKETTAAPSEIRPTK